MFFIIAFLIISIACATITIRTLVGYSEKKLSRKLLISSFVVLGWFGPMLVRLLNYFMPLSVSLYQSLYLAAYSLFGFSFILFCFLMLRDILWYAIYGIARLFSKDDWSLNPRNLSVLSYANNVVIGISVLVSVYALYEGSKSPAIKQITLQSNKISRDVQIVQLSDLHLNRASSAKKVSQLVEKVNNLSPDVILLTGDIIDDDATRMEDQLAALSALYAPSGVFASLGNHEYYSGLSSVSYRFRKMGFRLLFNRGAHLEDSNVFVSGIPDAYTANAHPTFNVNFEMALRDSQKDDYKILMSHTPDITQSLNSSYYDLVLAGHTHGGQIFPFHFFVKKANKFLSGDYEVNGMQLHVSNGTGTWGPPMRLFAPSEITLISLQKK